MKISKSNWLEKVESLALRKIDVEDFDIICIYRFPNLSKEEYILQELLNKVPFTSDKPENIIIVGDFNLPHVDGANGLVASPVNLICHYFRITNKYLDLFSIKGLY